MSELDLLIVRVQASHCGWTFGQELAGLEVHHVDTLLYLQHQRPAPGVVSPPLIGTLNQLGEADGAALTAALANSFEGYVNHYTRNPSIDDRYLMDGYIEWGLSHLASTNGSVYAIHAANGDIATFACVSIEGGIAEVSLAATHQDHRGKGLYVSLLNALGDLFDGIVISTQLSNTRVLEIWRSIGWTDIDAFHTYHILKAKF